MFKQPYQQEKKHRKTRLQNGRQPYLIRTFLYFDDPTAIYITRRFQKFCLIAILFYLLFFKVL